MMSLSRRALMGSSAVLVVVGSLSFGLAPTAHADVTQLMVVDRAEAWYGGPPVANCSSPVGCPPVSAPSAYPANTLHVGVIGGSENARTYIALDLSAVPTGTPVLSAMLTMPVSSDSSAGNVNVSAATPVLCLAAAPFADGASGSSDPPPGVDCDVKVPATYKPAGGAVTTDSFTADLSKFFEAWKNGSPNYGIAILPAPMAGASDAWHVAFNGRQLTTAPHITATLTVSMPRFGAVTSTPITPALPTGSGPPSAPQVVGTTASPPAAAPVVAPANAAPANQIGNVALSRRLSSPPWPFLWLPLFIVILAVYSIRTFTRPIFDGSPGFDWRH
jgi:hypothetical protein